MDIKVKEYIGKQKSPQKEICQKLRDIILNTFPDINEEMKIAAAKAIAGIISEEEITNEYVIPNPLDPRVVECVASAVSRAARETGVARV